MKLFISACIACLFAMPAALQAQMTNGSIVTIKNPITSRYLTAGSAVADSPLVMNTVNPNNIPALSKWRVLITGSTYMFQSITNGFYLGVQADSNKNTVVQRRLTAANRTELTWSLVRVANTLLMMNSKNGHMLQYNLTGTESRLVHVPRRNISHNSLWQITAAALPEDTVKKVLYDVMLHYIAVSEATRNRIDNGDCSRVFGQIKTEIWELDNNNQKKRKLTSYDNMPEFIYNQENYVSPPTEALSFYQAQGIITVRSKVTYNVPEPLLKTGKLLLLVKVYLGSRHKDSDLSSYDALKMKEEKQFSYILNENARREQLETISERYYGDMKLNRNTIPASVFGGDDTHKFFVSISCSKM